MNIRLPKMYTCWFKVFGMANFPWQWGRANIHPPHLSRSVYERLGRHVGLPLHSERLLLLLCESLTESFSGVFLEPATFGNYVSCLPIMLFSGRSILLSITCSMFRSTISNFTADFSLFLHCFKSMQIGTGCYNIKMSNVKLQALRIA